VAQPVECLFCKGETLSSNPVPPKKQKEEKLKGDICPLKGITKLSHPNK
jgi:hypothetical protein